MTTIRYLTSLLTFYLRGEITVEQNFVRFKLPNTILGIIPLGARKESVPVTQIASTQSNFKLRFFRLIFAALVIALGFYLLPNSFAGGLIILILGANMVINSFTITLDVNMTSGKPYHISFFILEKGKADRAESLINQKISGRLDDTNVRQQTDRVIGAISDLGKK